MKKVISYILIISMILSICFVPASAAVPIDPIAVDLLTSDEITYQWGDYYSYDGSDVYSGYSMFNGRSRLNFKWKPSAQTNKYDKIIITFFYARSANSTNSDAFNIMELNYKLAVGNVYSSATRIGKFGSMSSSAGVYEQWLIQDQRGVDVLDLEVKFNTGLLGGFMITDVTGFRSVGEPVNKVNIYRKAYFSNSSGQLGTATYNSLVGQSIPYGYVHYASKDFFPRWYYDLVHVDIPAGNRVLKYYDKICYDIRLIAPYSLSAEYNLVDTTYWNDKVTFSLYETNASDAYISLPVDISCSLNYSQIKENSGNPTFCVINLSICVDVSQYDLSLYTPDLSLQLPPVFDTGNDMYYTYFHINHVTLIPPIQDIPWYASFFQWCKRVWDNSTIAIVNTIESVGNRIVAAFKPFDPGLPDVQDQLATDASKFHDEMDVIETVPKPTIEPGDLPGSIIITPPDPSNPEATEDTEGYVDPSDPAGTDIMTTLTSAPNFFPAVTIVLTIAIVSLLLYGVGG